MPILVMLEVVVWLIGKKTGHFNAVMLTFVALILFVAIGLPVLFLWGNSKYKNTPMLEAAWIGDEKKVRSLLDGGEGINAINESGITALHTAVRREHQGLISMLIDSGADPNIQNKDGATALHIAARKGDKNIVSMLILAGADPDITNIRKKKPVDVARNNGRKDIEVLLMKEMKKK